MSIILLCECGWADHPDTTRPNIWLTPELINGLTKDHPVMQVGECPKCGYDVYIMKKCVCNNNQHGDVNAPSETPRSSPIQ